MIIVKEDGSFLVLEDAKGHQGVDVIVGGNNVECSKLLSTSGHHIDTLLGEFYPGLCCRSSSTVEKLAFCPNCLQQSWPLIDETDSSLLYNVTDFLENHVTLCCHRCESSLSLREVAPDILLLDLPNHLHLQSDKLVLQETDENCIGEGGYGKVYRAQYNGDNIALKLYNTKDSVSETDIYRELREELDILIRIHHENIVAIKGVGQNPLSLALELAPLGSLNNILKGQRNGLAPLVAQLVARQVASGLSYLHSLTIIYRDLKPANILVWSLDTKQGVLVKLSDYGVSRFAVGSGLRQLIGTEAYMAPEMWKSAGTTYSDKVDIFAYGLVLFELVTGLQAFWQFKNRWDIRSAVDSGFHPSLTKAIAQNTEKYHQQDSDSCSEDEDESVSEATEDSGINEYEDKIKQEQDQRSTWKFSISLKLPVDSQNMSSTSVCDHSSYVEFSKKEGSGFTVTFGKQTSEEAEASVPQLNSLKPATVCHPFIQYLFNKCTSVTPGERPPAAEINSYLALYPTKYVKFNSEPIRLPVVKVAPCSLSGGISDELLSGNTVLLYGPRMCCAVKQSKSSILTVAQIPLQAPFSAHCTAIAVMGDKMWVGWSISNDQHWVTVYSTKELETIVTISMEDSTMCFAQIEKLSTTDSAKVIAGLCNGVAVTLYLQENMLYTKSHFQLGDPDQPVTSCCYEQTSQIVWIGCSTNIFLLNTTADRVVLSWSTKQQSYSTQSHIENLFNSSVGVWSQVWEGITLKSWDDSGSCCHEITLEIPNEDTKDSHFFTASASTDSYLWASTSNGWLLAYSFPSLTLQAKVVLYSKLNILVPFDKTSLLSVGTIKDEAVEEGTDNSQTLLLWKHVTSVD